MSKPVAARLISPPLIDSLITIAPPGEIPDLHCDAVGFESKSSLEIQFHRDFLLTATGNTS